MQLKQKNKSSFDNYQLRFDILIGFKWLNSYSNYVPLMHENVSDTASPLDDIMT